MRSRSRPSAMRSSTWSRCEMRVTSLLDDGPVVGLFGDVVTGGSDEFHAAFVGRVIRPRSDERRQKRVVHVDDSRGITTHELRREDLHIACKHDEVDACDLEQRKLLRLAVGLILCRQRNMVEGIP